MKNRNALILFVTLSILLLQSCSPANTLLPTKTEVPTATEDSSVATTATAIAETRDHALQVIPTSAAEESAVQAFVQANIAPDLELAGYSTDVGTLALGPLLNVDFELSTYQPANIVYGFLGDPNPTFTNFVFAADVDWESEPGFSGCGIVFRGEDTINIANVEDFGDLEVFRNYASFNAIRLSGQPAWNIEESGSNAMLSEVKVNLAINLGQGSTNHYVLVVDGLNITVYANGERLGEATLPVSLSQGQIALLAFQAAGLNATCTFDNLWVWELPG